MKTGETIKATELNYRGLYIYLLTNGKYGVSGFAVDTEELRDSRFVHLDTLEAAKAECDAIIAQGV